MAELPTRQQEAPSQPNAPKPVKKTDITAPKPTYTMNVGTDKYSVEFDVNINPTKRGIKIQFTPQSSDIDLRQLPEVATKIAEALQGRFAQYKIQFDRDTQPKDPMVIGFMIPLISLSDFIMKMLKGGK